MSPDAAFPAPGREERPDTESCRASTSRRGPNPMQPVHTQQLQTAAAMPGKGQQHILGGWSAGPPSRDPEDDVQESEYYDTDDSLGDQHDGRPGTILPANADPPSEGGFLARFWGSSNKDKHREELNKLEAKRKQELQAVVKKYKKHLSKLEEKCKQELEVMKRQHKEELDGADTRLRDKEVELQGRIRHLDAENVRLRSTIKDWQAAARDYKEREERLVRERNDARVAAKRAKGELEEERKISHHLRQDIKKQEATVTEAHAVAISLLTRDVSSDFPDDEIKACFRHFIEGEFSEWCRDYRREGKLADLETAAAHLRREGLLRQDQAPLPDHLQFDLTSKAAPVILLSAALARDLCRKLLQSPLFLAPEAQSHDAGTRQTLLHAVLALPQHKTIDWRIRTCELLEQVTPPDELDGLFTAMAKDFADAYSYLCEPLDQDGVGQLVKLYQTFGRLAMRLAKCRAVIKVQGLGDRTLDRFRVAHGAMSAHSAVKLPERDASLDGRPVCVVTWPRIVSTHVDGGQRGGGGSAGSPAVPIVWTNAVVWVSNRPEKMDVD